MGARAFWWFAGARSVVAAREEAGDWQASVLNLYRLRTFRRTERIERACETTSYANVLTGTAVDWTIAACAFGFVIVLAVAAYWDASIRVVHTFEALQYLAAAVLCVWRKKIGYLLGVIAGLLWLGLAGRGSGFIQGGFQVLGVMLRTHHVIRPDILIAVPGAITAAGLVLFSLVGYIRLRNKRWIDAGLFELDPIRWTV